MSAANGCQPACVQGLKEGLCRAEGLVEREASHDGVFLSLLAAVCGGAVVRMDRSSLGMHLSTGIVGDGCARRHPKSARSSYGG